MKKYLQFINEKVWFKSVVANNPDIIMLKNYIEGNYRDENGRVDINAVDDYDDTLLIVLSRSLQAYAFELIEYLLKQPNIDVNHKNSAGKDALYYACDWEHIHAAKLLLKHPNIHIGKYDIGSKQYDNFIDMMLKTNTKFAYIKDYELQKKILDNNRTDIIILFNQYDLVIPGIKKEYAHLFIGADLNLL